MKYKIITVRPRGSGRLFVTVHTKFQPISQPVTLHKVSANDRGPVTRYSANGSTVPVIVVQDELPRHEQVQPVIQLAYRNARPVNKTLLLFYTHRLQLSPDFNGICKGETARNKNCLFGLL
jgi:hypothetical protein